MTVRIVVIGDFSGRASRGLLAPDQLSARPRLRVDRDDLEERLRAAGVEVQLASGERLGLKEFESLEPDHLFRALPSFQELRRLRARLEDPETFAAAAREMGALAESGDSDDAGAAEPEGVPLPDDLLSAALEATETAAAEPASGAELVRELARELVAPYVVPAPDPRLPELLATLDRAVGEHMRDVLADPGFRTVEDAWLGLDRLTRRLTTGRDLELRVLDAAYEEFREAVAATGHAPVLGGRGEAPPATLVLVLHRFEASAESARVLGALAERALEEGAILVTDAHPSLAGAAGDSLTGDPDEWDSRPTPESAEAWEALRRAHGQHVVLVTNRALQRPAYGTRGRVVEAFPFEELSGGGRGEITWGHGGWCVAEYFGNLAMELGGPPARLDTTVELERFPLITMDEHGEVVQVPCAEVFLPERARAELAGHGLSYLVSVRGSDSVRVGPIRSLSRTVPGTAG